LDQYKRNLNVGNLEKAENLQSNITSIIKTNSHLTPEGIKQHACNLQKAGRNVQAIPLWYTAAICLPGTETTSVAKLGLMKTCVSGIYEVANKFAGNDENIKHAVKLHFIHLMLDVRNKMERVSPVDKEVKCSEIVNALQMIALIQANISENRTAMETLKQGLQHLRCTYVNMAQKRKVFGALHEQLGDVYSKMLQHEDANFCYTQAMDVYKNAIDMDKDDILESTQHCSKKMRRCPSTPKCKA